MKRHELITAAVGVLLLAAVGVAYWDLNRKIETVAATGRHTATRVDHIADAMPNLGVRMAWEEIHREISGAVVISTPLHRENGVSKKTNKEKSKDGSEQSEKAETAVFVRLVDVPLQTVTRYKLPLDTAAGETMVLAIKGIIIGADHTAVSMERLDRWTTDVELNMAGEVAFAVLPADIDGGSSFVVYKPFRPVVEMFKALRLKPENDKPLPFPVKNWTELAIYLAETGPPKGWTLPDPAAGDAQREE